MDLDEWELIFLTDDDHEFLEIHDHDGRNNILSRCGSDPIDFMYTNNYFLSQISHNFSDLISEIPIPIPIPLLQVVEPMEEEMGGDHDGINTTTIVVVNSQVVSFKEMMRENEFVDMKMDSPESSSSKINGELEDHERSDGRGRRLKIWKWSSTGIGAICSFGVAAATFYFIIFANVNVNVNLNGNHPQIKKNNKRENDDLW